MELIGMGKKKFTAFCGIEMLISAFTNIVAVPYAEPVETTTNPPIIFFRIHFNIILPSAHAVYNEFLRFIFCD